MAGPADEPEDNPAPYVYDLEKEFDKAVEGARAEGLGDEAIREHLRKQMAKLEASVS